MAFLTFLKEIISTTFKLAIMFLRRQLANEAGSKR
jgi:hypothetical protein